MKATDIFDLYETTVDENVLSSSGMENIFKKLEFGFFPLGSGIFSEISEIESAQLSKCKIMVLGNDFGTVKYFQSLKGNREKLTNSTIRNLIGPKGLNLNVEDTFFTNFHLGLRKEGTNIVRKDKLTPEYRTLCFNFFITQLNLCNPEIVILLGKEVVESLSFRVKEFSQLNKVNNTLQMPINSRFDKRKFILIPHPSMAHFNWDDNFRQSFKKHLLNI